MNEETKICHRCHIAKKRELFSKKDVVCLECNAEKMRAKRHLTPKEHANFQKLWKKELTIHKSQSHKITEMKDNLTEKIANDNNEKDLFEIRKKQIIKWAKSTIYSHSQKYSTSNVIIETLIKKAINTSECWICGGELTFGQKNSSDKMASLDRVNNDINLTNDTLQIICLKCNSTKSDRTMEEFIEYCWNVVKKFK